MTIHRISRAIHCVLIAFLFLAGVCSCDEHVPLDLGIHPGYILCDDGRVLSPAVFDASVNTPVAVFFAPQTESHPALAVLLDELQPIVFCDTLMEQNTSGDVAAFDGYVNTVALQTTYLPGMRETVTWSEKDTAYVTQWIKDPHYYGSPLGLCAFYSHWFYQSDYVPSVAELSLLYLTLGTVNPVIEKCGGTPVGTTSDDARCWYWSSTEVSENSPNQAWLVSMADGSRHKAPKVNAYRARLIVEYNPLSINN